MKIIHKSVLLLKSENNEDKYDAALTDNGFLVKHIRTLEFRYINLEQLHSKIRSPDDYDGIIFTTPRSVKALKEALANDILDPKWSGKCNYVVGEATYDILLKGLNLECRDKKKIKKPLLFPCGNLKTDILIELLRNENIKVDEVTVYETVASTSLEDDFISVTSCYEEVPEFFAYFSPSGVNFTYSFLMKLQPILSKIKFIAIGPTTETALKEKCLTVTEVAKKPTPRDLLAAILNCK
ncbi:hypothetical protein FQR65_LT02658 [Abscondita terminalis]|nr:hypothetical protein FQR65_LT02658 [Abscondita terminalis]